MKEVDVVVVGCGLAGLAAAVAARRLGLSVAALEKAERVGGGTAYSWGMLWAAPNHIAEHEGIHDDPADVQRYMTYVARGEAEAGRMRTLIERTPEALRFFEACGIRFQLTHNLTDHHHGVAPGSRALGRTLETAPIAGRDLGRWCDGVVTPPAPYRVTAEELIGWGGMNNAANWPQDVMSARDADDQRGLGVGLISHFLRALLGLGTEPTVNAGVERLIVKDGRVVGVETTDGRRIAARHGVVLATGGYESNPDMVAEFEGLPGWRSMFPSTVTGDGLRLGMEIGASIRSIRRNMALFLGYDVPDPVAGTPFFRLAGIIEMCSPHTVVVNGTGRRFADESYFQGVVTSLHQFDSLHSRYANLPCYLIFDHHYVDQYSFAGRPRGAPVPDWVTRADSLPELAERLRIDRDQLPQTIHIFNENVRVGRDAEFHRGEAKWSLSQSGQAGNPSLGALDRPPYYGIELHPSALSSTGLKVDQDGRVLHVRGHVIPGLYASGNVAAHTEYGGGYQVGHSLSSAMTFGYLSARHMHDFAEADAGGGLPGPASVQASVR